MEILHGKHKMPEIKILLVRCMSLTDAKKLHEK